MVIQPELHGLAQVTVTLRSHWEPSRHLDKEEAGGSSPPRPASKPAGRRMENRPDLVAVDQLGTALLLWPTSEMRSNGTLLSESSDTKLWRNSRSATTQRSRASVGPSAD